MQKRLFSELGLSEPILKAVEKLGFEETSPIQSAAIPLMMAGKDIVGQSMTGSGKTAAFAIPAIERVADSDRKVQILVLTPTRELATQIAEEFARLSLFRPKVHAVPIYGGASYDRQFSELRKGPQIVIGTPGRVIDHIQRNTLDLSEVKMAVLDECDRMLDMGFREDMERILSVTPKARQTVFFSATLPPPIKRLIEEFSNSPEHIKIEGQAMTVPTVEQVYFDVPPRAKLDALTRLIDVHDARLCLVFANTRGTVDDLADALIARGYSADRLHGGMSQVLRTRTMAKFKKSGFDVLVATDVAGRGIDVDDLDLVINFDLPYDPEDYLHRVGRTGRAGRKGVALTLISGREVYRLQNVERFTRQRIRRGHVPTWDQVEEKRMSGVLDKVRATLESGKHTSHGIYIDRLMDEGHSATDLAAAMLHGLLSAEGIETEKPGAADPFARKDAPPVRPAAGKPDPKPAPAKKPAAALVQHEVPRAEPAAKAVTPAPPVIEVPATVVAALSPVPAALSAADLELGIIRPPRPAKSEKPAKPAAKIAPPPDDGEEEAAEDEGEEVEEDDESRDAAPAPAARPKSKTQEFKSDVSKPKSEISNSKSQSPNLKSQISDPETRTSDSKSEISNLKSKIPPAPRRELPAPASGYKWITLSLGKNDGMLPRDIVDAITQGGDFSGKAVGLIKIHDTETDVQVMALHAAEIVETLDGGNFEGKTVRVHFARTLTSPYEKKPGKFGDRPGSFPAKHGKFGGKPGGYGKPRAYGDKPRSYGPPRDDRAPRPFARDDGPRPFARDASRPYSRDDRPRSGPAGREDFRGGPPRGPRKSPGGFKKGPGRW